MMRKVFTAIPAALMLAAGSAMADEAMLQALKTNSVEMSPEEASLIGSTQGSELAAAVAAIMSPCGARGSVISAVAKVHGELLKDIAAHLAYGCSDPKLLAKNLSDFAKGHEKDIQDAVDAEYERIKKGVGQKPGPQATTGMGGVGSNTGGEGSPIK